MFMNLAGIRKAVKLYLGGYPERGDSGTERLNDAINMSLRRLWGDLPKVLLREQLKFNLQPSVSSSTLFVANADTRVMGLTSTTSTFDTNGEHDARWVDITDTDGVVHTYRIRETYRGTLAGNTRDVLVLDRPWINATDTGLSYRLYTAEYPIPGDVQSVQNIWLQKQGDLPRELRPMGSEHMMQLRTDVGLNQSGEIIGVAVGDHYQLPAPQYTPSVTAPNGTPTNAQKWGWDPGSSLEDPTYEEAGTFSYRICHVWGRRPLADGAEWVGGTNADFTSSGERLPFYISAPSPASSEVSTTWGGSRLRIQTPNVDLMLGYAIPGATSNTYSGIEKWIFRARHAVVAGSSLHATVQADNVYRLWRITDANDVTIYDHGSYAPTAQMVLKDFMGHRHIRFERTPDDAATMAICTVIRQPPTLTYDSDAPHLPAPCIDAIVMATASILAGHRDGNLQRTAFYDNLYEAQLEKLRREYATDHFYDAPFGDGLGTPQALSPFRDLRSVRDLT